MQITEYLAGITGIPHAVLFAPGAPMVRISAEGGVFEVEKWDVPGVPRPSPADLAAAAAAPDPPLAGPALVEAINAECKRRIFSVASRECQTNIIGNAAAGALSTDEMVAYRDSVSWIASTIAAARALIEAKEPDFAADTHWPICPDNVVALAARF